MKFSLVPVAINLALAVLVSACIHTGDQEQKPWFKSPGTDATGTAGAAGQSGWEEGDLPGKLPDILPEEAGFDEFSLADDGSISFKSEIVYFKFDDFTLTPAAREQLAKLAEYLQKVPETPLKIRGHADARGSTEYNLALGLKRAESVRKFLSNLGLSQKQLNIVSYGEEKPAVEGDGETVWAKNRRVDFKLIGHH